MIPLSLKNLFADRARFAMSVAGIGFAVFLITLLLSLFRGWNEHVGSFVEHVPADIWVAREGAVDFLSLASPIPETLSDELGKIEGVSSVAPLVVMPTSFDCEGRRIETYLAGYDESAGIGGPLKITGGDSVPGEGGIIIDAALAKTEGLALGDLLVNSGRSFRVTGIAEGSNFVATQVSFVPIDAARRLLGMEKLASYYLITLEDPREAAGVAAQIERSLEGVDAFTSRAFADATRERTLRDIIPILIVVLVLAFIVGTALTGLLIYTATIEKAREFGILKAVGFTNRYLYGMVVQQSLITGMFGFMIGVVLNLAIGSFAEDLVPQFVVLVRWSDIAVVLGATLVMSILAALVPARRLAGIDPVMVFKA
jgi:putative ABC transport system permease protein